MLYQKARILPHAIVPPTGRGKYVWVQAGPPQTEDTIGFETKTVGQLRVYRTHVVDSPERLLLIGLSPEDIELLPEFQEDVPLIELEDWLTEDSCPI